MAELPDKRKEQFCRLLSTGMKQAEAYVKAGYRAADRSNASKLAREPEIVQRVAELQGEEAQRQAELRVAAGEQSSLDELKRAIAGAATSGNWAAVVAGSKVLGEADGSFDAIGADAERRPLTLGEMLKLSREIDPSWALWLAVAELLMLWDGKNNRPMPPWTNGAGEPVGPYLRETKDRCLELVE
jgi:hypothetical protein